MDPARIIEELQVAGPRPACSDAERRAARALARRLRAMQRRPRTETLWVRPGWPAAWLLYALVGLAGSLASLDVPAVALGVLAAAGAGALLELGARLPVLSLLWAKRATQNVISLGPGDAPVRLLVTAATDAPRAPTGLSGPLRRVDAALRRATAGLWPAPLALVALSLVALAACAGARLADIDAGWLGAVQLAPTFVLLGASAVLAELALAGPATAANPASSAPAAALALVDALDRRPPRRMEVDVLLAGAGDARSAGMRAYVRARRREVDPETVAVLHLEPCGAGDPRAWRRDGSLLFLRLHPTLLEAARAAGFEPHNGRGLTGALAARRVGWPAIAIGRLDRSRAVPDDLDREALEDTVARCADLVRRLDAELAGRVF